MTREGMNKYFLSILFFCLAGLIGCATAEVGRQYDTDAASHIQVGQTTEAEVISLLGQPLKVQENADGSKVYTYLYVRSEARSKVFHSRIHTTGDKLIITFNRQGVVQNLERSHL